MMTKHKILNVTTLLSSVLIASAAHAAPVPGYIPPVTYSTAPAYADDTRGVFVPSHEQHRLRTSRELELAANPPRGNDTPLYAQENPNVDAYEKQLNMISSGVNNYASEMDRIATNPGMLNGGEASADAHLYDSSQFPATMPAQAPQQAPIMAVPVQQVPQGFQIAQMQPQQPYMPSQNMNMPAAVPLMDGGVEMAVGKVNTHPLDMHNSLVRIKEDRISIRRTLQRMMDQIGAGDWQIVWDLAEHNAALPDTEIAIETEEPFVNVLNAMLARMQTRSGQPLRVIRYDRTKRLVITDRQGGHQLAESVSPVGVEKTAKLAVTEDVLREAMVSLHYDEVPLVDALENIINQAGRGEWRLRMYAGLDQVLRPAHIEEPFSVAMDRLLRLFNLKYEVFPGGKLVVVTQDNSFGFNKLGAQ